MTQMFCFGLFISHILFTDKTNKLSFSIVLKNQIGNVHSTEQ